MSPIDLVFDHQHCISLCHACVPVAFVSVGCVHWAWISAAPILCPYGCRLWMCSLYVCGLGICRMFICSLYVCGPMAVGCVSVVYDDMHPKIIKQISTFITIPLCHIINCSLASGEVPSKFKVAKVVPILIYGQHDDLRIYCPVSILTSFAKIVQTVANRLFLFLYNILYECLFGFIQSWNTTLAILSLVDYLINSLE